jgi:hypothetical protein
MKNPIFILLFLTIILQGCASAPETLKTTAQQNQENMAILSDNVHILLNLYKPLLESASNALIYQRIGKIEQEMIAIVGAAVLPAPSQEQTWRMLFEKAAVLPIPKREKYLERFHLVEAVMARGLDKQHFEEFRYTEGWIFEAASNPEFTPQFAHSLLKSLNELRKNHGNDNKGFYAAATTLLIPHDHILNAHKQTIENVNILHKSLAEEIEKGLRIAAEHTQSFSHFADQRFDVKKAVDAVATPENKEKITDVLERLAKKYIKDSPFRDSAIQILTGGLSQFITKSF